MGAAVLYAAICVLLFIPVLMGECLPRDLPETALCDAAKQREVIIYLVTFLAAPVAAAAIGRFKSARLGVAFLLAASILPFILCVAANAVLGP